MSDDEAIDRLFELIDMERAKLSVINKMRDNLDKQAAHTMCDLNHYKRRLYELGWRTK